MIKEANHIDAHPEILFPNAFRYYREGLPEAEQELKALEALEGHLEVKKVYKDSSNPKTHMGVYMSAKDLFKTEQYSLF